MVLYERYIIQEHIRHDTGGYIRHTNKSRIIKYSVPGIKLKDTVRISKDDTDAIYLIHPNKQNNQL